MANPSAIPTLRGGLNYNLELRWEGIASLADARRRLREQAQRTPAPQCAPARETPSTG